MQGQRKATKLPEPFPNYRPNQRVAILGNNKNDNNSYVTTQRVIKRIGTVIKDYGPFVLVKFKKYKECFHKQDIREV